MPRPDEGLIHAWLDGQLPPVEAARIEELAASDPEWAAAVAEARGLVAASSRILSALDGVPAGVVPKGTASRPIRMPWWTRIAAAVVVVVGGSVVVMQNAPEGRMAAPSIEQGSGQPRLDAPQAVVPEPVVQSPKSSARVPAPPSPVAIDRVPVAAPTTGALAGASAARDNAPTMRREALVAPPVAEVSAPQSLVAKAAPSAAQSIAPSAAPQAEQAATQDRARAQNTVRAQRGLGGVLAFRSAQGEQTSLCYRVVPDSSRASVAVIMRAVRADGDTLRLIPVESNVPQRAWIVWGDGMTGVMTTRGDVRSAVRVIATPTTCPAP